MTVDQLKSLRGAIAEVKGQKGIFVFDDYIIYHNSFDRYFTYDAMHPEVAPGTVG
jgi:ribosomal protein S17